MLEWNYYARITMNSVVNGFCQSHDVPNLFVCDASVFVTSGGANPPETVMAIALRTVEYLIGLKGRF